MKKKNNNNNRMHTTNIIKGVPLITSHSKKKKRRKKRQKTKKTKEKKERKGKWVHKQQGIKIQIFTSYMSRNVSSVFSDIVLCFLFIFDKSYYLI